jgi:hypothetical protein
VTRPPTRLAPLGLLAAALLVRAAPLPVHRFSPERTFTPDSATYLDLAKGLAEGHGFGRSPDAARLSPENPSLVEVFRTPGYPLLLALVMRLGLPVVPVTIVAQIGLDSVGVVLSFLAARRLLPLSWALVAGAIQVLDIPREVYANMVMSDVLFTFLAVLAVWLLADTAGAPGPLRSGAAGAAVSLATAVRPLGAAMVVPAAITLALRRARVSAVVAFTTVALAFPAAWIVRNGVLTGEWTLSSAFDYNLCLVAAAKVKARAEGVSRAAAERALVDQAVRSSAGSDPAARARAFRRVGYTTLRQHPAAACRELVLSTLEMTLAGERGNVLRLFGLTPGRDVAAALGETARSPGGALRELGRRTPLEVALVGGQVAWNALLGLLCALGGWEVMRRGRAADLVLYGLTATAILAASVVVGTGRMRIPASPMIAVLAGAGGMHVALRRRGHEILRA